MFSKEWACLSVNNIMNLLYYVSIDKALKIFIERPIKT